MNQPQTVIIIGGGLGGLFTGALLTKEGCRVTVLEKNSTIGGGLQTFRRGEALFETGMHMLGGLRPGGAVYKICRYLGITDRLLLRDADHHCMDTITYLSDGTTYSVPEGREAFTAYFASLFPHEEQGLRRYVDTLYRLADEVDLFYLRPASDTLTAHSQEFLWAADELIAHYIRDERLRDVLAYMNPMYGGVRGHTPAYIHALINVLYIDGTSRFVGGSQQMADALAAVIGQGGGTVLAGQRVVGLHVDGQRQCTGVTTADGRHHQADCYIAAIHPQQLLRIADAGAFPKAYTSRVASIPNTYSAFTVYICLRPGTFPYINHTCYMQDDYGRVWDHARWDAADDGWPHGFMYMTPADTLEQTHATKMIVNCLMPFEAVSQWADTTVGRRGPEYEQWKERLASRVLDRLQLLYPGFRQCVDRYYTASPLTIRDYYGQPEGALYGVQKDCQNLMLSQLPVWTKVGNLLLTGQNVNLHGICGVPLTAINTVEAIVGRNRLVEKIRRMLVLLALWLGLATGMQALNLKEFLPAGGGPQPSTAVIVCPGGSYFWLAGGTEGDSVARSLTQHGLAAYVLRYRTAGFMAFMTRYRYIFPGNSHPKPLSDVQEAILLLRRRGYSRVGVMGFSAGGHLALSAAIFGRDSLRPDFIAPCYPVVTLSAPCVHKRSRRGLLGEWRKRSPLMCDSLSLERHVHSQMPPVFLMNCKDDPIVDYRNSELMDSALTAQGVPHRYIQYATGGHGFGTTWRKTSREAANWLREFLEWLGVISKS